MKNSSQAIEEFAEHYMELRDDLAWRAVQGETLTVLEKEMLNAFDEILDSLMPGPEPMSQEAQQIIQELKEAR